jgi:hypothetical protein
MNRIGQIALVAFALGISVNAAAEPPLVIFYEGTLFNEMDDPVNEAIPMEFSIYAAEESEEALWVEPHTGEHAVEVIDGLFVVELGTIAESPIEPSWFDTGVVMWLGIVVGEGNDAEELLPRQPMGGAP